MIVRGLCGADGGKGKGEKSKLITVRVSLLKSTFDSPESPWRPVLENRSTNDVFFRKEPPYVTVVAVVAVVS